MSRLLDYVVQGVLLAISRGDLPAFPERIHAKWAQW